MINGNYARKPVWRVIWLNREKETKHFPHASYWSHFSDTNVIYLKYEVKPFLLPGVGADGESDGIQTMTAFNSSPDRLS